MKYQITYHHLTKVDLKQLAKTEQKKILKAILKKLTAQPESFGKPLLKELKGFYRLRVGHYRVIYRIEKKVVVVFVLLIGPRRNKEAYKEAMKRI